tara:strand:+ start:650 stop:769 length:120 start_codon:yes stop_codon:yes gene_type:complete
MLKKNKNKYFNILISEAQFGIKIADDFKVSEQGGKNGFK